MIHRIFTLLGVIGAFVAGLLVAWQWKPDAAAPAPASAPSLQAPARPPTDVDPDLPTPAAPVVTTPVEPILQPTPAEYPEIVDLLRTNFLESPALLSTPLTPDTVPEILERSRDKIHLSPAATQGHATGVKTLTELLPGNIGYWRPRAFETADIDRLVREWAVWKNSQPTGLILDLRHFTDPNNFTGAAPLVSLFTTPGRTLFTLQGLNQAQQVFKSERQPLDLPASLPVIVLINRQTRGAAEAAAAALRSEARALLVGQPTAGEGGLFRETRLKSKRYLRLATARAATADGTDLLTTPLEPDVLVEIDPAAEKIAFLTTTASATKALAEPPPLPRLNQDVNAIVLDAGADRSATPPPADPILKAGVDAVTAITARITPPSLPAKP
jgi:hypothetical protein